MKSLKNILTERIADLKFRHAKCLRNACDAIDDDNYYLHINDSCFLQGQITMAREVIKIVRGVTG